MKVISQLKPAQDIVYTDKHILWDTTTVDTYNIDSEIAQNTFDVNIAYVNSGHTIKKLSTDGLILLDTRLDVLEECEWRLDTLHDCILLEFFIGEDAIGDLLPEGKGKTVMGFHNLSYINSINKTYTLQKNAALDSFFVFLSKPFYYELIGKTNRVQDAFARHVELGLNLELSESYLPMNFDIINIINEVRSCTRKGSFHRLCLEIKLLQLLLLQFEQAHNMAKEVKPRQLLHETDINNIKNARIILEEHYNDPPTIKQLSYMVGVNEFKLKNGFKTLFNSTIHGYVLKLRMDKANQLVKEQHLQVKEVAMELGYKSPSHFSAAFKKHFGFLPTEMAG